MELEEVKKKAWISCLLLTLFSWGLQPFLFPPYSSFGALGSWADEFGSLQKFCCKNGILNFQAFPLISQSNFLDKYNPPQVVLGGPGTHSHMLLGCNRKSLKYMQQKRTHSQLSLKLNFLSYSSCGYGHF